MDFFELKAFLSVAKTRHFARASKEVNLSPSALSRLISRLEEECGYPLFDRTSRDVTLTDKGKRFVDFAQKVTDEQESLMTEFSSGKDVVSGTLRVYASVTACYTIMAPFIKKLSAEYPAIQLSIETGDPAGAISAIKEGRAELAVAALPESSTEFFDCTRVRKSPLVFAASSSGKWTSVEGSPQDIVSSVPLILPKAGLARERFNSWIKSRNVRPQIAAEAEGNEAIMALAALDLGIGLVPKIVLETGPYTEGFICHEAGNALGFYDIGFIRKATESGSENTRKIRQAVTAILRSMC